MTRSASPWVYLRDAATGLHYYANTVTRETSWQRPEELDIDIGSGRTRAASKGGRRGSAQKNAQWVEHWDDAQSLPYFFNELTGESLWVLPADDDDDDDWDDAELTAEEEVEAKAAKQREKNAARRLKILEEILSTETTYVTALKTLKKVRVMPTFLFSASHRC